MSDDSQNITYTSQPDRPWDRQLGEGDRPWKAFREYLVLRDFVAVSNRCHVSVRTVHNYSSKWSWSARCDAYDVAQRRSEDAAIVDERVRLAKEQLAQWGMLRKLAISEALRLVSTSRALGKDGKPGLLKPNEIITILKEATHAERLIIGEATERTETTESGWDLSKLTTDELAELSRLQRKATS